MNDFKKQTKRALALFLSLVMCLGLMQVTAFAGEEGTTDDALPAGVSIEGNVLTIAGDGTAAFDPAVIAEKDINGVDTLILDNFTVVNSFGNYAETYAGIKNLEVKNVETIAPLAFYKIPLKSVSLENVSTVGAKAFISDQNKGTLQGVTLRNVSNVLTAAFANQNQLVMLQGEKISLIDSTSFANCTALKIVELDVNTIGQSAFSSCTSLTVLNLSNVKYIGTSAFYNAGLNAGKGLEVILRNCDVLAGQIGSEYIYPFWNCYMTKLVVDGSDALNSLAFYGASTLTQAELKNVKVLGSEGSAYGVFNNTPKLETLTLENVDTIYGKVVNPAGSFKTLTIRDGVTGYIDAFSNIEGLEIVDESNTVNVHVVYMNNGSATGIMPDTVKTVTISEPATFTVPQCAYEVPSGLKFVGWNTSPNGSGTTYQPGTTLTVDTSTGKPQGTINFLLYAQWESEQCICNTKCTENNANAKCPACSLSWTFCKSNTVMKEFDLYTHFVPEDNFAEADKAPTLAQIPQDYSLTYQYIFGGETETVILNAVDATKVMYDQDDSEDQGQHHTDPACKWTISVPVVNGGDGTIVKFQQDNYDLTGLTYGRTYSAGEIRAETGSPMGKDTSNGSGIFVITNKNTGTGNDGSRDEIHVYNRYNVTYTVTYTDGVNDQEIFADQTETVISGAATPAFHGTLTREGYTFTGWSPAVSETVSADVTYVAQWKEVSAPTYTLSYNANGGEGAPASQTGESGSTLTVSSTSPTRSGYTFQGWATTADAASATVQPNGSVTMTADVTLYAVWSRNSSGGGGGGGTHIPSNPTPTTPDPGTTITDPDVPLAPAPGLNSTDHYAYIAGYPDGTVRPQSNITRAEVATIFFRLMTDEFRTTNWASTNNFPDVADASLWYNNAVSTAAKAGLLKGKEDGKFYPSANITRAEFATIAARFTSDEEVTAQPFPDTVGHWAEQDIIRAVQAGWIKGNSDGTFRPNDPITRAEAMTLVNRMLDRVPDKDHMLSDMVTWPDNPVSAWFYEAVQEATNSHDYERDEMGVSETWTGKLPDRDWSALEKEWSNAASSTGKDVAGDLQKD